VRLSISQRTGIRDRGVFVDGYLLFDAGGTVVFPQFPAMRGLTLQMGQDVPEESFRRACSEFMADMDVLLRNGLQDIEWPRMMPWIVERAGVDADKVPALVSKLHRLDEEQGLWTHTYPWVRHALDNLADHGYRMSVISNASGTVEQRLDEIGLSAYFERVFDSTVVGLEKPDPRFFRHALDALGLQPAECLYVGDVFHIDVLGANTSGIGAVHLDPYGLYPGWPGVHLPSVAELPAFLQRSDLSLTDPALFPLRPPGV
jgi:putative hydrolase of the HAD superfamily